MRTGAFFSLLPPVLSLFRELTLTSNDAGITLRKTSPSLVSPSKPSQQSGANSPFFSFPPSSYVTKSHPFTSSVPALRESLKALYASGGGDGPEAVTAGIKAAMDLDWRPEATKMCVLIADAPCHGIGEYGDGFPQGAPDGEDPLVLARQMAAAGIPLVRFPSLIFCVLRLSLSLGAVLTSDLSAQFVVACEPALSGYQFGLDWFRSLTVITSALLVPLTTATLLSHVIVGSALEHLEMERLIQEVGQAVAERIHAGMQTVDDVAKELHERLLLRGEETKQLKFESIHVCFLSLSLRVSPCWRAVLTI